MPARERLCPTGESPRKGAPHDRLSQLILSSPRAEQTYRDFMWMYVGHPNEQQRKTDGLPTVLREWHNFLYNYSEQVLAGYTEIGQLIEVRSVLPVDPTHPKDYFMVMSRLDNGHNMEPIVHQVRPEHSGMVLQLIDPTNLNSPPKSVPGRNAPVYDQWRIVIRPGQGPEILDGRRSRYAIRPIVELAEVTNSALIERDGQLEVRRPLGRVALGNVL